MYEHNRYRAEVLRWVDGDTVWLRVDLGQSVQVTAAYRLARIDAPEKIRRKGVSDAESALGKALTREVGQRWPAGTGCVVRTVERGKYGRYVVEMEVDGVNVSDALLAEGKVAAYE